MSAETERHPDGAINTSIRNGVLHVEIDRPEKRNGFTPKMMGELAGAFSELERNPEARVAVVSAAGAHFTAGLDLPKMSAWIRAGNPIVPADEIDPFGMREPLRTKPVIVALKGISFTTAVSIMLSADISIAAEDCRFGILEVKRGIIPGLGAIGRMIERAGWGNAMKYLLTGTEFGARDALRMNMVQEVVPVGQELARATELAEMISAQAPLAVAAVISNGRMFADHGWLASVHQIPALRRKLYASDDAKAGIAAFESRSEGKFSGR